MTKRLARLVLLGLAGTSAGCAAGNGDGDWQMPATRHAGRADVVPDEPGDLPESAYPNEDPFWRWSEAVAWQEAETTGRGLLVDFYADWCHECRTVAVETWRDPLVRRAVSRRFVPLRIDVTEISRESREQLERYRVMRLPTSIAISPDGRELWRFSSPPPPDDLIANLRESEVAPGP